MYGEICVRILYNQNELLNLKDQNLDQILSVDKICFLRLGHIYNIIIIIYIHYCIIVYAIRSRDITSI